jgi:ATP/ADP translocase
VVADHHKMKYKTKPAIETFVVRVGDGLAAMTVLVGVRFYALATRTLFLFNVVLVLLWLLIAMVVVREYRRIQIGKGAPSSPSWCSLVHEGTREP